jgi:hypothetical protein
MIKAFFGDEKYTTEELNARLKFFIGIILGLTLFGIVFVVLYSLIFVTQPMNGMSPVDNKFFELIIPVATFLTGTLSGIMLAGDDKDLRAKAIDAAGKSAPPSAPIAPTTFPTKPFMPMASPLPQMPVSMATTLSQMPSSNFGAPAPVMDFTPQIVTGFNGKPAPVQPPQPEI